MSVSTLQTESIWQGVRSREDAPIGAVLLPLPVSADAILQWEEFVEFPGRLLIPNAPFTTPEQFFTAIFTERGASFENAPRDSWPKVRIRSSTKELLGKQKVRGFFTNVTSHRIEDFLVRPSNDTVEAELLYTRFMFCLYKAGECSLNASGVGKLFGISSDPPLETDLQHLLYRAKVHRKLRFIERVFDVEFPLPSDISADAARLIDLVFRGITEGEFAIRSPDITFPNVSLSEIDSSIPAFNQSGRFSRSVDENEEVVLFGQRLHVGPITVRLDRAELTNLKVAEQNDTTETRNVRFEVLDNQIVHRFESYARQPRSERTQRLIRFKYELAQEEPQELVDLIDEPLQRNVSSREASQIAVGWTQYNDLPDRYCPQVPELDAAAGQWHVPIYLVYSNGEGGPVGEVVIDEKTGVIISHTPVDELRSKGRALAEQILHA